MFAWNWKLRRQIQIKKKTWKLGIMGLIMKLVGCKSKYNRKLKKKRKMKGRKMSTCGYWYMITSWRSSIYMMWNIDHTQKRQKLLNNNVTRSRVSPVIKAVLNLLDYKANKLPNTSTVNNMNIQIDFVPWEKFWRTLPKLVHFVKMMLINNHCKKLLQLCLTRHKLNLIPY